MRQVLIILGPTASGKTALALQLAQFYELEIISLDSALIYKGMDIGTAKPTISERQQVVHHLVDIIDPAQSYSAAQFVDDCLRLIGQIMARGHLPVICGGTMLYYKALIDGLSQLPTTEPQVREQIALQAKQQGWPALHQRLEFIDPVSARKIAPFDKQRISRALEVYEQTGRPISSYYAQQGTAFPYTRQEIILLPQNREQLRHNIALRFESMLKNGFIDEVQTLKLRTDLNLQLPSMRCVGYRQVWEYLEGQCSYDRMRELAIIATAHLAKHQLTWLRSILAKDSSCPRLLLDPYEENVLQKSCDWLGD